MGNGQAERYVATKILKATFRTDGKGRASKHSFMYGKKGAPSLQFISGTTVYYDEDTMLEAAFSAKEFGHKYLKQIPISAIISICKKSISDNYSIWADETFMKEFDSSYYDFVSEKALLLFSKAVADSEIFNPEQKFFTFPIQTIRAENEYIGKNFSLLKPNSLSDVKKPFELKSFNVNGQRFPPLNETNNHYYPLKTWLCTTSPHLREAQKNKAAILAVLSIKYDNFLRYQFNLSRHVGGYCSFGSNQMSFSIGAPHTPSVSEDLILKEMDIPVLETLDSLLDSPEQEASRKVKALEYFYRAWFLDESERYPFLFMCLESLYGDSMNATQSIIDGVKNVLNIDISESRIRLLIQLRGSVIHGRSPEIYDSRKYAKYYKRYRICPSKDLALLVAACLNSTLFDNRIAKQNSKHRDMLKNARTEGKINSYIDNSILVAGQP